MLRKKAPVGTYRTVPARLSMVEFDRFIATIEADPRSLSMADAIRMAITEWIEARQKR